MGAFSFAAPGRRRKVTGTSAIESSQTIASAGAESKGMIDRYPANRRRLGHAETAPFGQIFAAATILCL